MKPVYCISGMGADERIFKNLLINSHEVFFINWIIPSKAETISEYALRLTGQIKHANPILIGISFGGMMCIEISRIIAVEKIIIISSIKSNTELPTWMRLAGKLKLDKIVPLKSTKLTQPLQNYKLGVESDEEKQMAIEYRRNVNRTYADWAIHQVLNWDNKDCPVPLYHIHGSKDRIFPLKRIKPDFVVHGGGHLMIMNRSDLINSKINEILSSF